MSGVLNPFFSGLWAGLGILLALLLLTGCAGPLRQRAYSVRESPENAGFDPAILRGKRVGFLTATVAGEDVRAKYVRFEEVAETAYSKLLNVLVRNASKKGNSKKK